MFLTLAIYRILFSFMSELGWTELGTVHYLLGVRDRCFGVRDKDFFYASEYGTQRFFVFLWYGT